MGHEVVRGNNEISPQYDYDMSSKGILNFGGELLFLFGANAILVSQLVRERLEKSLGRSPK